MISKETQYRIYAGTRKDDYTGCSEDYTVIRYVGSDNATAMQQRSLCLEEYISYLNSQ